ncbi:hypothetical protein GDO81_027387 [Engystomops pustulosus]|nr:hypothetical protein GDO81_027387 [Engystomops pustulosus]
MRGESSPSIQAVIKPCTHPQCCLHVRKEGDGLLNSVCGSVTQVPAPPLAQGIIAAEHSPQSHTDMETKVVLLLGLLAVCGLSQASDVPNDNQLPKFCRTSDCPSYQLVKKYDNFEHRQYEETRWVTTSLEQDFLGFGMVKSFRRLFSYINGSNSEGLKINMTVPVVIYMPLKKPPAGNSTMSFFVPHEVVNPPKPTDSDVYLEKSPAASIYVK